MDCTHFFRKVLSIDVFDLLYEGHNVIMDIVADHKIVDMPSYSHLRAIHHFVCNARVIRIDGKTHVT